METLSMNEKSIFEPKSEEPEAKESLLGGVKSTFTSCL